MWEKKTNKWTNSIMYPLHRNYTIKVHNTSQRQLCQIERRKCLIISYMHGMWPSFLQIPACLHMSDIVWQGAHLSHSQLTAWVAVNGRVHSGKEEKQVKQDYYVTSLQCAVGLQYDNASQRLLCQIERTVWTACSGGFRRGKGVQMHPPFGG